MNAEQATNAKPIIELLEAVRGVIRRDVALGLYEEPELKLAIEDRKRITNELKAQGCSDREIARALGVDPKTLRNDRGEERSSDRDKKAKENNSSNGHAEERSSEPPTKEEAEESHQEALYDHACSFLDRMTDETRQRFFAFLRRTYKWQ